MALCYNGRSGTLPSSILLVVLRVSRSWLVV